MFAGAFVKNIPDAQTHRIGNQHFRDLLHGTGPFNGKARSQDQSKYGNENEDEGTHYDVLRDGQVWILRLDVKELKNGKR